MTAIKTKTKPKRPAGCPLFPHANGQWAKKIKGKIHYFGTSLDDAVFKYAQTKDNLYAGVPVLKGTHVKELADIWLAAKELRIGPELTQRSYFRYVRTARKITDAIGYQPCRGLGPGDMTYLRSRLSQTPTSLSCEIAIARMMFKFGNDHYDLGIRYTTLKPPSAGVMRRHKASSPKKMYPAAELQAIMAAAKTFKPMILLALNCGYGNGDVYALPWSAIDGEWIDYPRPKTGIDRRAWLWPETRTALGKPGTGLIFKEDYFDISQRFTAITKSLDLYKPRVSFYCLRHIFQTVGNRTTDNKAVSAVMGHVDKSMGAAYQEEPIADDRLRAVCSYVRKWLFA